MYVCALTPVANTGHVRRHPAYLGSRDRLIPAGIDSSNRRASGPISVLCIGISQH